MSRSDAGAPLPCRGTGGNHGRSRWWGERAHQRGAAAVFVAISLVASIAALALTLDLGRLYFAHRDLQRQANMAALDAARAASGCLGEVDDRQAAAQAEAAASVLRNGGQAGDVAAGTVLPGRRVVSGGVRDFVPDPSDAADAIEVKLVRPMPARLMPLWSSDEAATVLVARAVARLRPVVSLDVRSTLANVSSPLLNSLLSQLLGGAVELDVASYRALFDASVELDELRAAAGVGTLEQFLETEISAPQFLNLISAALTETANTAVGATLDALAAGADASRTVVPGQVLEVPEGTEAQAADAVVAVGTLVTALAQAANGDNLINLNLPPLNIPGVTEGTELTVRLIERARPAVGPAGPDGAPATFASNAQALLQAQVPLAPVLGNPVRLSFYTRAAHASGEVAGLECAQRGRPQHVVLVDAQTRIGELGIGQYLDLSVPDPVATPVPLLTLSGLPLLPPLTIRAAAEAALGAEDRERLLVEGPFPSEPVFLGTPPGEALAHAIESAAGDIRISVEGLPGGTVALDELLPLLDGGLATALSGLPASIADALRLLDTTTLGPLLEALGVTVGMAEVRVLSVTGDRPEIFVRQP